MATDNGRSIGAVLGDIAGNLQHIVRAELRLAKAEIGVELTKFKAGALLLVAGGVVAVLALGVLLLSAVYALATIVAPWAAALLVGLVTAVAGGICVSAGIKAMRTVTLRPQKTVETIQETMQWAKTRSR